MNKDEADRCISIAVEALKVNDYDKAIYHLENAQKFHQTNQVSKLLKQARDAKKNHKQNVVQYSFQDEEVCKEIIQKTNYYEILNITKDAKDEDIKKSFRELARKYHPDKSKCPSSNEAFGKMNKAYKCLSDPSKRQQYDETGTDDEKTINFENFFTVDFGVIMLINFFQDTIFSSNHYIHRLYPYENSYPSTQTPKKLKLVPLFFLILMFLLSSVSQSPANYCLISTGNYKELNVSEKLHIPYYTNPNHNTSYYEKVLIESNIEQNYLAELNRSCEKNKHKKQGILNKAKRATGYTAKVFENYAESIDLADCIKLEELIAY
jgi:DnaJ homolog subfamily B member 12